MARPLRLEFSGALYHMGWASVSDTLSGYVKVVEYDTKGRPSKTVTSLGVNGTLGNHYEKVTYDQYGRAYQVFDAARNDDSYTNNGVEYRYNERGYQHQIVDAVRTSNNVTRKVYRTITEMDALGNVTAQSLGNGVSRSATYNQQTGRVSRMLATSSTGKIIQDLRQTWDNIGNLDYAWDDGKGAHI